jgi:beta-glucosidase/6-phospho-beta-glucosidase/beta-galactosidase
VRLFRKKNNIKSVVIGVDFFSTNANQGTPEANSVDFYEAQASFHSFLHYTGLKHSRISVSCSIRTVCNERSYTQVFTRTFNTVAPSERAKRLKVQLEQYATGYYGPQYRFDATMLENFKQLRSENPGIKFVAFTSPESAELFNLIVDRGLFQDYVRWITILFQHFDEVYDFMGVNSVTSNADNYLDAHHFSPRIGLFILQRIQGSTAQVPLDFGVRITHKEIEKYHLRLVEIASGKAYLKRKAVSLDGVI